MPELTDYSCIFAYFPHSLVRLRSPRSLWVGVALEGPGPFTLMSESPLEEA